MSQHPSFTKPLQPQTLQCFLFLYLEVPPRILPWSLWFVELPHQTGTEVSVGQIIRNHQQQSGLDDEYFTIYTLSATCVFNSYSSNTEETLFGFFRRNKIVLQIDIQ